MYKTSQVIIYTVISLLLLSGIANLNSAVTVNFAYATNNENSTLSIINPATNTITGTILFSHLARSQGVAIAPSGLYAYVTNNGNNTVSIINTATNAIAGTITGFDAPGGVAFNPSGTLAYVTNYANGTVSIVNTETNSITESISGFKDPEGVAISPTGTFGYVTNLLSENAVIINTATDAVTGALSFPYGVAFSPTGTYAYIVTEGTDTVSIINTATNTVSGIISGFDTPQYVAFSPDGSFAYVTNNVNKQVSIVNTQTNVVVGSITASAQGFSGISIGSYPIPGIPQYGSTINMSIGQSILSGPWRIQLQDPGVTPSYYPSVFLIFYNGESANELSNDIVYPGNTAIFNVNGNILNLKLIQNGNGLYAYQRWALVDPWYDNVTVDTGSSTSTGIGSWIIETYAVPAFLPDVPNTYDVYSAFEVSYNNQLTNGIVFSPGNTAIINVNGNLLYAILTQSFTGNPSQSSWAILDPWYTPGTTSTSTSTSSTSTTTSTSPTTSTIGQVGINMTNTQLIVSGPWMIQLQSLVPPSSGAIFDFYYDNQLTNITDIPVGSNQMVSQNGNIIQIKLIQTGNSILTHQGWALVYPLYENVTIIISPSHPNTATGPWGIQLDGLGQPQNGAIPASFELWFSSQRTNSITDLYPANTGTVDQNGNLLYIILSQTSNSQQTATIDPWYTPATPTFVPITITTSQDVPFPRPFQQMITFNPSEYSSYEAADLGNIRFYEGNPLISQTELYSWCESGCYSYSTNAIFWVNIPYGGNGAGPGIAILNMTFERPTSTEYDGNYAGEAPQYTVPYGEYDNGADVFPGMYQNFAGTSCPALGLWICGGSSLSFDNSATISNGYLYNEAINLDANQTEYVIDADAKFTNIVNPANGIGLGLEQGDVIAGFASCATAYVCGPAKIVTGNGGALEIQTITGQTLTIPSGQQAVESFHVSNQPQYKPGLGEFPSVQLNYSPWVSGLSLTQFALALHPIGLYAVGDGGATLFIQWARARAYPPNGIMPSVSFGSLTASVTAISSQSAIQQQPTTTVPATENTSTSSPTASTITSTIARTTYTTLKTTSIEPSRIILSTSITTIPTTEPTTSQNTTTIPVPLTGNPITNAFNGVINFFKHLFGIS